MFANDIEVITLFVDDINAAKHFYDAVFGPPVIYQDEVSAVLKFSGILVNLLQSSEASTLVEPLPVAASASGVRMLLTIRVDNVDSACVELVKRGAKMLNGPVDRPWGRRTAAFADPSGHVWEIAQDIG